MRLRRGRDAAPSADAPVATDGVVAVDLSELGAIDTERALRLVRIAAALIAMAAAVGTRDQAGSGLHGPAAAGVIFAGAIAINLLLAWTSRRGWSAFTAMGGQVLDVAASLGLVLLLDQALDDSAWMVLLLPIVMGGVRFGAAGTLLGWTLACSGYLALVGLGAITVAGDTTEEFAASLQRFAFLLALAVPVAALTQWLQHRWEHQRGLTAAASLRAQRLELVERLARSFIGTKEPRLLANLADAGVQLGFTTVTITLHSAGRAMTVAALGESRALPTDDVDVLPEPGETLITHWSGDDDQTLTSVSVTLDAKGTTIAFHGWTDGEVDADLAQAFGLLGAHAGVSLQAARMLADLERQALQDPLTGLANRRAFDDEVDARTREDAPIALLILDVDHFKHINDTYGHPAGDRVLRVIAERLRTATATLVAPAQAMAARIGGDEFALIVAKASLEAVAEVADRMEASMADPIAVGADRVPVSFSIGIADAETACSPRDLFDAADEATYQSKSHGRNRSSWAPGPVGSPAVGTDPRRVRPGNLTTTVGEIPEPDSLMSGMSGPMGSGASAPPTPAPPRATP